MNSWYMLRRMTEAVIYPWMMNASASRGANNSCASLAVWRSMESAPNSPTFAAWSEVGPGTGQLC